LSVNKKTNYYYYYCLYLVSIPSLYVKMKRIYGLYSVKPETLLFIMIGVMEDYKLRDLRVSHTLGWSWNWNT
jgi:hypothetical protein